MLTLTANEARVLGVLIEKAQTTPQQYPLTLNALTNGCNQKNNREPITNLSEEQVLEAIDGLRSKGLVREVMLSASRVEKFRHIAREVLEIGTSELVLLAELLLRGPQTLGELRGRASRMHPLETTDIVKNLLDTLANRPQPLVKGLPAAPGDRAPRFAQLLCPNLHPLDAPSSSTSTTYRDTTAGPALVVSNDIELERRIEQLEAEVAQMKRQIQALADSLGAHDVLTKVD